jgi:hypothetical protein
MSEPETWLKDYIDSKFDGLEKYIDAKFQPMETHEQRISNLEKWRAYVLGACVVISFAVGICLQSR